jgi:fido (protein-threonine AMPylation protein)
MTIQFPAWRPESHPEFDTVMTTANSEILTLLQDDAAFRTSILRDPRVIHSRLYAHFAPPDHPEYAGTYRGTSGTSLEGRFMGGPSVIQMGKTFNFRTPAEVPDATDKLLAVVHGMMAGAETSWDQLWALTNLFAQFGAIHPFLEGNGHVQRALFAAAASAMDSCGH